jgi:hypothetical protein
VARWGPEPLAKDLGLSKEQVEGLRFEREDDPDDPDHVTLTDATVFQPFANFSLKAMRLDIRQVEAWWLGEPEYEDDSADEAASGNDQD